MYIHHKEFPEQFTDTPYKAGIDVHCIKGYHGSLLTLIAFTDACNMLEYSDGQRGVLEKKATFI